MESLSNAKIRALKARAQRMKATVKLGKEGLTEAFLSGLDNALKHQELVKVKFEFHKEEKKDLAPQMAERTGSHLVMRVGNVVVLYREKLVEAATPEA